MRKRATLAVAATLLGALAAAPTAHASPVDGPYGQGLDHCTATDTGALTCHFDVAPGTYDVSVTLGGEERGSTAVAGETRRALLAETVTGAGQRVARSFTVDVRDPEGEPTGPAGSPGLDLVIGGGAPSVTALRVTPARAARRLLLVGDSTVCDQPGDPYSGWGQMLPVHLKRGIAVANHADSGESTVSFLANPALFDRVEAAIRPGDPVLIQLAHNDKQTDAATYRANLTTLVERVRARGGEPVLVTPVVRRWFSPDGTLNNGTALLVNGLGVDHPAEIRALAAGLGTPLIDLTALTKRRVEALGPEASKALYLTTEKRDNTHTSVRGATEYAALVAAELRALGIVPDRLLR
ncbi:MULTISPECIES: rhamnogalacturonan acetylesterase [Streptomyces]|uniref:Rhamnogalacturonan acetylesterase n=1 Tax=Streptomyces venezuelae (strain ATCC 10712 / CBS 650.69 / DSM 40230 / JCM 4526 / NBRC 13096 / PD 04745) TaxID=953739 RepID=F2RGH2_STRVP|nr:rhamnogalacturonan acetylesterase [Streptomyces venezuelae]APE25303.1 carbohydrate esterase [Streptomyces venezuelae]QES02644.1 rhamnogalacturonan acetylesterase [Streptomyces venezuelae ATCC 10712]CCA59892.1 rhamnogalacturonan acetylesterase [Streptomyces venezuelae ATCC 10712]